MKYSKIAFILRNLLAIMMGFITSLLGVTFSLYGSLKLNPYIVISSWEFYYLLFGMWVMFSVFYIFLLRGYK